MVSDASAKGKPGVQSANCELTNEPVPELVEPLPEVSPVLAGGADEVPSSTEPPHAGAIKKTNNERLRFTFIKLILAV